MFNIYLIFRSHFYNLTAFDAVVFHERNLNKSDLPKQRSSKQLFVHYNLEAPFYASIRGLYRKNNAKLDCLVFLRMYSMQVFISLCSISTSACLTERMRTSGRLLLTNNANKLEILDVSKTFPRIQTKNKVQPALFVKHTPGSPMVS